MPGSTGGQDDHRNHRTRVSTAVERRLNAGPALVAMRRRTGRDTERPLQSEQLVDWKVVDQRLGRVAVAIAGLVQSQWLRKQGKELLVGPPALGLDQPALLLQAWQVTGHILEREQRADDPRRQVQPIRCLMAEPDRMI